MEDSEVEIGIEEGEVLVGWVGLERGEEEVKERGRY